MIYDYGGPFLKDAKKTKKELLKWECDFKLGIFTSNYDKFGYEIGYVIFENQGVINNGITLDIICDRNIQQAQRHRFTYMMNALKFAQDHVEKYAAEEMKSEEPKKSYLSKEKLEANVESLQNRIELQTIMSDDPDFVMILRARLLTIETLLDCFEDEA